MKTYISSKPYKQWCKARGINFVSWMSQFPHIQVKIDKPPKKQETIPTVKRETWFQKIKRILW